MSQANLKKCVLINACLIGANLQGANLCGALLSDADLSSANLTLVRVDEETKWPAGFDLIDHLGYA